MKRILTTFKSFDSFGQPINVQYQGTETYRTPLGSCLSILTWAIILAFALEKAL